MPYIAGVTANTRRLIDKQSGRPQHYPQDSGYSTDLSNNFVRNSQQKTGDQRATWRPEVDIGSNGAPDGINDSVGCDRVVLVDHDTQLNGAKPVHGYPGAGQAGRLTVQRETGSAGIATFCITGLKVTEDSDQVGKKKMHPALNGPRSRQCATSSGFPMGYTGWYAGALHSPAVSAEQEKKRRESQLQAYIAWINSQLKKRPGARLVEELETDMHDGVALILLVEIVSSEKLQGVHHVPSNTAEKRENVEKVLQFMHARRVRMHHTDAQDIVEGNRKAIMRLILALAAHFKPSSVKQSNADRRGDNNSVTGIAHGAAAALADARRDASRASYRPRRPKQLASDLRHYGSGSDSSEHRVPSSSQTHPRERIEGASSSASPASSTHGSPRSGGAQSPRSRHRATVPKSQSQDFEAGYSSSSSREPGTPVGELNDAAWSHLVEEREEVASGLEETKRVLLKLQELLLSGQPPDGQEDDQEKSTVEEKPFEGSTPEEQVIVLKSRLQQAEQQCKDLRDELSKVKNESLQLQGTKAGLQKRLAEEEESYVKVKGELLKVGFAKQSLETEKADLQKEMNDKDRTILDLRRELWKRDKQIEDITADLQLQLQDKDNMTKSMRAQILDLHDKLRRVCETEADLSSKVESQDRKMSRLEGKIMQVRPAERGHNGVDSRPGSARSSHSNHSDDYRLVQESLRQLRGQAAGPETYRMLDQLEHSTHALMEKLDLHPRSSHRPSENHRRLNYEAAGDIHRSPVSGHQGFASHRYEEGQGHTKVLYFTDRTVTPFMGTIPKRLGEVRLRDVKNMFGDRHTNFRFHFKAMDPEFGTVKEEVTNDDDIIPGWEGKIVAWIEEDHE